MAWKKEGGKMTEQSFNVTDPELDLFQNFVLEASAGTGKTFSIENIVTRLLIESQGKPLGLEQILIVTFTRAATAELKVRVRNMLDQALGYLRLEQDSEQAPEGAPD